MLRRKLKNSLLCALIFASFFNAPHSAAQSKGSPNDAQERIVGLVGKTSAIELYADSEGTRVLKRIAPGELPLPLEVVQNENEMFRVRIRGELVWLDGALVTVQRRVEGDCLAAASTKPVAVASTRGASKGCR